MRQDGSSPPSFFLMVILQRAWLVMSRSGVRAWSQVDLASTRSVCQDSCGQNTTSQRNPLLLHEARCFAFK